MISNDLKPSIKAQLKWKDGSIVNLTGCTVKFRMEDEYKNLLIDEIATVLSPEADGWVQYDWQDARSGKLRDTDVDSGKYPAEFEVTFTDEKTLTFPTKRDFAIVFRKEIA